MAALTLIILALSFVITTALPVITSSTHSINNGTIIALDSTNVRLRCEATGEGTLTYQWRKVSGSLSSSAVVESNGKVLHIGSITIIDGGRYYCVVSDNNGNLSSMRVQVTVKRRPSVNTPSDQQLNIVRGNQQVTLTCEIIGDDITGGYWERVDGDELPNRINTSTLSNDKSKLTITIKKARPTYSGRYRCVVNSEIGSAQSRDVTVTIKIAAPTITKQPTNVTIEVLQNATFICEADGFEVKYEWKRHDDGNIIGNQSSLSILRATSLDEDRYYCVAMTEGGYAFSNNVTLTVNGDNFTIVKQPGDVTVSEGGIIVLSVTARGTGRKSFTYEWKKVGSDSLPDTASGGNSTELTITSVTSSDSGFYYCIVMNKQRNTVRSDNATVNVFYITAHPKDTIVGVGRNVTLTCNASGADNLMYQWMRMGNKTIPSTATGVNSSTLVIPSIRVDDSGQYKCVVSSGEVNVMSEYGAVSVLKLTVITMNSNNGDITVAEGNNVTLRCEATVNVTMNYEWSRELGSLPEMNVMGHNAQNLIIYNVKVQNSGQYYCQVEIGAEKIRSMSIQVTARRRPSIIDNSDNQSLNIVSGNEQVTLTCEVTGDDISGGYWERVNGKPLIEAKNMSSLNDNKTTLQLIINEAHPGNSGMYRCVVYSRWGAAQSRNVQVTITIAPPMITTQPTDQITPALEDVTFACEAEGFEVKYEWKRHNGSVTGGRQSSLTISKATPLDEDQYYCVAMTEGGYAFSNNVTLTVNDRVRIRTQPKDIIVSEDDTVVLSIDARGRGLFTYEWKKVGIDSLPDTASGGNSIELTITSVKSSDSGLYYCIVMNQWGTMAKSNNATVNVLSISTINVGSSNNGPVIVVEGSDVMLRCEVTGDENLNYQWSRVLGSLSDNVGGINSKTLTIRNIAVNDSGQYYCEVDNGGDSVSSMRIQVTARRKPSIINRFRNQRFSIVSGNEQVTLTCEVIGDDITGGYWERVNDNPLPVNNNMSSLSNDKRTLTINISRARPTHSGRYRCVVYSQWGVAQSENFRVTITIAPPMIIKQPSNQIVTALQNVTFTCEAKGFEVEYEWKRQNGSLTGNRISDRRQSTLTVSEASPLDVDQYYCVAMTVGGYAFSKNVTLIVNDDIIIMMQPKDVTVSKGGTVELSIDARGEGRKSFTYEWKKVGSDSLPDTASGGNSTELTITSITSSDSGLYYCTVMNQWGTMVKSNNATVNVLYITAHPKDTRVAVGIDATLTCNASGADNLKYQWIRMGNKTISSTATGGNSSALVIPNITVDDSGQYKCVVSSGEVNVMSEYGAVSVLPLPVITTHPNSNGPITVAEGSDVMLTCEATGKGKLNYQWRRVSGSLPNSATMRRKQTLIIGDIAVKDSGQYYCEVNNGGRIVSSMRVQVTARERSSITNNPSDEQLSIVSGNEQVTLTCEVIGDDITGGYWERVKDNPLPVNNNMSSLSNDKRTLTITIRRARPTHSGMYRCVVYSQWGVAQSRNIQVNITIAPPNITTQPINVVVRILQDITFTCEASGFDVKYEWKRHGNSNIKGMESNLTIPRATPLDEDQYYCVAMTEGGYAFSNNVTLTVNDNLRITMHPRNVTVSDGGKVVLSINAKGRGSFTYEWKKVGSDSLPDTASGGNSTELTITSITSSDSGLYYCIVMNQWGTMVKSNNATVNVLYITNNPNDELVSVGRDVTLTCKASGTDNLKYQWMRIGNEPIILQALGANTTSLTINNVTVYDSGKYECVVSSGNVTVISNCGALSVVELSLVQKGTTFLQFNWSIPTSCYERDFYYTVHFMQSDQSMMKSVINFNGTYTLDNLSPYKEYSVYVVVGSTPGSTGRQLESVTSMTVIATTFAGEPMVIPTQINQPEMIINDNSYMGTTHKVNLPVIDNTNGPFSHLYIVVIDTINTKRMVINVQDITTAKLIEESMNPSSSYYVAAVVNASQYIPDHTMSYILGAGDHTSDPNGYVFHNRELEQDVSYFFRIFSIDSSPENEISTTTQPQGVPIAEGLDDEDSSSSVVGPIVGVLLTLAILIAIILLIIFFLIYYKKKYLKSDSEQTAAPISDVNTTAIKEKFSEPEKKVEDPPVLLAIQADEPAIQETSFLESTEVKTSVGQPTTLVIGLPDYRIPEVVWKKDAEPVNHPVLPDGSLFIINTDHTDEGEYTVIINRKETTAFENLQLTVINPQLPNVEKPGHGVIKIDDFTEHVALLKAEKDAKLQKEFDLLDVQAPFTQHAAKLLCNKAKNRYKNIIPYDHSRVVLSQQDQITGSDYINASYIDGYGETRAYIAAQGAMKNTIDDFWRMVWEQNVVTIVMLTRLVEDAKAKCQQYWPGKGSRLCGNIKVTLHKEEQLANYAIRQFFVEQVAGAKNEIRLIYQFHFTAWPDHGVPKYATPLLEFYKKVDKQHKRKNNKPMLVHCSAGVGRTGTFITIDIEIQHLKKQNVVDVYDSVRKLRFWRKFMVQTISQYTFIHNALLEHIACGDTSIAAPVNNVQEKIAELSKSNSETNKTGFQTQFEKLTRNSPKQSDFMYVAAVSPKNKNKNRCQKLLPPDTARVTLPQLDGNSDYINFCFIDGYRQIKAFLAGPGPMQSTAVDFWTMIWEKKSHAVVMLGQLKENGEEVCYKYWPDENRTAEFGKFLVETITEDAWDKDIVKRTFKLTNTKREDDARTITQLQYVEWSQDTCPSDSALIIDMIEVLERVQRKTGNGPITVHCSDGVGRSGTFCALMVSINRFKAEQMVDVFRTIITMRTQRPGVVANADQFEFIHQGLITMIKRFSPYSNFTDGTAV